MAIKRRNHGRGHSYIDTDTGEKIRSVTAILGGIPKPALVKWAAETTANYALDNWDELNAMPPSERLKAMYGARTKVLQAASKKGTTIHALASKLVADEAVDMPDGLEPYVLAYVQFLDDFGVKPILVEAVVVSHEHTYCGTLDLVAGLLTADGSDYETWLLDIKSGSGVYGETALQEAGYGFADAWVDDDGTEHPMPIVDRYGVVHLRPDQTYELLPLTVGERQHQQFLYAGQICEFLDEARDLVGEPIPAPRAGNYRLEDEA
jgi:hypothetical protein